MPLLVELQQDFARAVVSGEAPDALFLGCVSIAEAMKVHRDTVMGALANALRISYPTVDALVGEQFFDQTCSVFAAMNPPKAASLAAYGEDFAEFLAEFAPAAALSYLPDVARLDHAVEAALRAPDRSRRFVLDASACLDLPRSLAVLRLMHPADEILAALEDDAALAGIVTLPAERFILVWRKGEEAAVQHVSAASGHFLASLLAGESAEAALRAASADIPEADVMCALQAEIFSASFCTIISTP